MIKSLASLILLSVPSYAFAGQIVALPKTMPEEPNNIVVVVKPNMPYPLIMESLGGDWTYKYDAGTNLFGEATLELTSLPDNFSGHTVRIRIPYYEQSRMEIFPYAMLSKIKTDKKAIIELLDFSSGLEAASTNKKFEIYNRSKYVIKKRIENLEDRTPTKWDIHVAYLFLRASSELYEDRYVWVDDDTSKIVDWLDGHYKSKSTAINNVLGKDGEKSRAKSIIIRLRGIEANFAQKLYDNIQSNAAENERCRQYALLTSYLDNLSPEKTKYFKLHEERLISNAASADSTCKNKEAEASLRDTTDIETAKSAYDNLSSQIQTVKRIDAKRTVFETRELSLRTKEMEKTIRGMQKTFGF